MQTSISAHQPRNLMIMAESVDSLMASIDAKVDVRAEGDQVAKLQELTAQATAKYAMKDYSAAAELYAYATELQADINGEMSSANANLLYAYGRCLYHVAVKKSDVLGLSKVAGQDPEGPKAAGEKKGQMPKQAREVEEPDREVAEAVVTQILEDKKRPVKPEEEIEGANKPYFQFTGDENFDDSGDDEVGDDEQGDDEDVVYEDDFSTAYEVLDMARVLLQKQMGEIEENSTGNGKGMDQPPETRQLMERLADTYDLQAEISLEGEKFPTAVLDLKSALDLKKTLFSQENSFIAEAHYKLSLALEFSSVTQQKNENGEAKGEAQVDEGMREEAAHELEAAISSCKLRIQKEEAKLKFEENLEEAKLKEKKAQIDDVKDMVKELSQRVGSSQETRFQRATADFLQQLVELRQPPVSVNDPMGTGTIDGTNPLAGILGSMLGESPRAQKARIEEASKSAHDLTGLVKKRKQATDDTPKTTELEGLRSNGDGKRKLEFEGKLTESGKGKKAKIENAEEG